MVLICQDFADVKSLKILYALFDLYALFE